MTPTPGQSIHESHSPPKPKQTIQNPQPPRGPERRVPGGVYICHPDRFCCLLSFAALSLSRAGSPAGLLLAPGRHWSLRAHLLDLDQRYKQLHWNRILNMDTKPLLSEIESELQRQISRLAAPRTQPFHEMLTYHMGWTGEGAGPEAT